VGATALGLALKGIGYDLAGIDFRKEEFAFQGRYEKAKKGVACTLVLLFLFFFALAYRYQLVELPRLQAKLGRLQTYQQDIYLKLFPEERRTVPKDVVGALTKKNKQLRDRLGLEAPDVISCLDAFREFSQGVDDARVKLTLSSAQFRQPPLSTVKGRLEVEADAYTIKEAVGKQAKLFQVASERVGRTGERVEVEYQLKMVEKPKPKPGAPAGGGGS
jgi:type II secretory pathway component PulL